MGHENKDTLLDGDAQPVLPGVKHKSTGFRSRIEAADLDNVGALGERACDAFGLAIQAVIGSVDYVAIHIHQKQIKVIRIRIITGPKAGDIHADRGRTPGCRERVEMRGADEIGPSCGYGINESDGRGTDGYRSWKRIRHTGSNVGLKINGPRLDDIPHCIRSRGIVIQEAFEE